MTKLVVPTVLSLLAALLAGCTAIDSPGAPSSSSEDPTDPVSLDSGEQDADSESGNSPSNETAGDEVEDPPSNDESVASNPPPSSKSRHVAFEFTAGQGSSQYVTWQPDAELVADGYCGERSQNLRECKAIFAQTWLEVEDADAITRIGFYHATPGSLATLVEGASMHDHAGNPSGDNAFDQVQDQNIQFDDINETAPEPIVIVIGSASAHPQTVRLHLRVHETSYAHLDEDEQEYFDAHPAFNLDRPVHRDGFQLELADGNANSYHSSGGMAFSWDNTGGSAGRAKLSGSSSTQFEGYSESSGSYSVGGHHDADYAFSIGRNGNPWTESGTMPERSCYDQQPLGLGNTHESTGIHWTASGEGAHSTFHEFELQVPTGSGTISFRQMSIGYSIAELTGLGAEPFDSLHGNICYGP